MMRRRRHNIRHLPTCLVALVALGLGACKTSEPETKVVVPSAATQAPEYEGDGSIPEQRYVIRMSNGEQDWEVQFPDVATGYEMHIPLSEQRARGPSDSVHWPGEDLTEADKELLQQLRRDRGQMEREGIYKDGKHVNDPSQQQGSQGRQQPGSQGQPGAQSKPGQQGNQGELPSGDQLAQSDERNQQGRNNQQQGKGEQGEQDKKSKKSGAEPAPYRPSYLLGIENVRKLYKSGKYELAMVRLKKLEEAYPGDVKILSMKGTLWLKLGREKLARKAWERVLQIDPDNTKVKEALQRLNESE